MRIVLMAHGSRDPRWREPFQRLAARMGEALGAERVRLAYMEFASPTLDDVADEAVADGRRQLAILPLFMAGGGHVAHDIPAQARAASARHPGLAIEILDPVGEDERVIEAMVSIARATLA